jgi:uncharacterized protein YdeI (YjbR/CyaY-like superfamily)
LPDELPVVPFASAEAWRDWLRDHHASSPGVWLKLAKKGSGLPSVTYAEAVDEALCFGWIDGQARSLGETHHLQKFTPRAKRSMWSKRNREKVAALIAAGRMQPAGLREIERAKADGRWDAAYDAPSTSTVPDDLQRELDRDPEAAAFFATLDSRNRYAILHRIQTAKKPETRARRIGKFVAMLRAGEKVY